MLFVLLADWSRQGAPDTQWLQLCQRTPRTQAVALECVNLVAGYIPSSLIGRLMVQNLISLESSMLTVIRLL